jgi:hypothetical protein
MVQFLWQDDLVSVARFIADCFDHFKVAAIHVNQPETAGTDVNLSLSLSLYLSLDPRCRPFRTWVAACYTF